MASTSSLVPNDVTATSFGIASQRLKDSVSKDDARNFTSTTMKDVWETARHIERQLQLRGSLRGFHRIQPFLAGIEKYAGIIEVLCQGTPYLPFIWAPIKLLLQIAQGHISALEKLIDAYAMIGEAMPRFDRLSASFKEDQDFQQVLGFFYTDILEFHGRAYKFFRQRGKLNDDHSSVQLLRKRAISPSAWKLVFDSLWKSFSLRFQGIIESLRKHRDLIDAEANSISIAEAKTWRSEQIGLIGQWRAKQDAEIDRLERERLTTQTREAVAWLGAGEEQDNKLTKCLKACRAANDHWVLKEPTILLWLGQSRECSVAWLNGKPGAGKSVICAKVIEHIQHHPDMIVIFYFCSKQQTSLSLSNEVLRDLVTQLLVARKEFAPYILETFANNGLRPTKRSLGTILEKLLTTSDKAVRIVVDGLDEYPQDDHEEIIGDLLSIKGSSVGACKILISSQKISAISKLLHLKPTIRLEDHAESIDRTISSYVESQLRTLHRDFSSELIEDLGHQIIGKSNGMFLWVKLVMSALESLYTEVDMHDAIQTLPRDIKALYHRLISTIIGDGETANQRKALRILRWMMVAERPIKRNELEIGIVLDQRTPEITTASKIRGDVFTLCNPIVDVEDGPTEYVSFCHSTALEYLLESQQPSLLTTPQAHSTVALSCVLYLTSSLNLIDTRVPEREKLSAIAHGFHDLHTYADEYWLLHLMAAMDSATRSNTLSEDVNSLCQSIEQLASKHSELCLILDRCSKDEDEPQENSWDRSGITVHAQSLLEKALRYRKQRLERGVQDTVELLKLDNDCLDTTLFADIRARYQTAVVQMLAREEPDNEALSNFKARHGPGAYLCRHPNCPHSVTGFDSVDGRRRHEDSHAPRFQCSDVACGFKGWTFKSRAALNKHIAKYHNDRDIASVPTSLRVSSLRTQEDRVLFRLKDRPAGKSDDRHWGKRQQRHETSMNKDQGKPELIEAQLLQGRQGMRGLALPPHPVALQQQVQQAYQPQEESQINEEVAYLDPVLENFDFEQFLKNDDPFPFDYDLKESKWQVENEA